MTRPPGFIALAAVATGLLLGGAAQAAGGSWSGKALPSPSLARGDRFGATLAIGKDLIAVGAYLSDAHGTDSGKVYFYRKNGDGWELVSDQQMKLEGDAGDQLGFDLAIDSDGKTLLAGAPFARKLGVRCGAVRKITLDGPRIVADVRVDPPVCKEGAEFGSAVAVEGGIEAVGARGEDHRRGRIYADFGDRLLSLDDDADVGEGDELGTSLTIGTPSPSGDLWIVAGAPFADAPGAADSGAAYVFAKDRQASRVVPDVRQAGAAFGYSVSLAGGVLAVGEPLADAAPGPDAGAVHRFNMGDWSEIQPVTHGAGVRDQLGVSVSGGESGLFAGARRAGDLGIVYQLIDGVAAVEIRSLNSQRGAEFGFAVATRGTLLAAGAFLEDGPPVDSGAAYVFEQLPQDVTVGFAATSMSVGEGEGKVALMVKLSTDDRELRTPVKVDLAFCPPGAGCTATKGTDFRPLKNVLTIPVGTPTDRAFPLAMVEIVPDCDLEGLETFTVRLSPRLPARAANPPELLRIDINDSQLVLTAGPLLTSEQGSSVPIEVGLANRPFADVTVVLATTDATEGTFSPRSLTFTPLDWESRPVVYLNPVDDLLCDGLQAYAVKVRTKSRDASYNCPFQFLPAFNEDDEVDCLLFSDGFESGTLGEWTGWFPP